MTGAHANLVFAHHSAGKARRDQFGCAHLRLMNYDSTAIRDGVHDLVMYNVSWSVMLCDVAYIEKFRWFCGSIGKHEAFPVK